jgi:hypothetical protein
MAANAYWLGFLGAITLVQFCLFCWSLIKILIVCSKFFKEENRGDKMELLLGLLILCVSRYHRARWTHFEQPQWIPVFFFMEPAGVCLYLNGLATGLSESGLLYFHPSLKSLEVQFYQEGVCLERRVLQLEGHKVWLQLEKSARKAELKLAQP